jgi:hypothetical protein
LKWVAGLSRGRVDGDGADEGYGFGGS